MGACCARSIRGICRVGSSMITDDDLAKALDRIARTADGLLLYRFLQKVLCGVIPASQLGALPFDHGRRSFASELMGRMAKGVDESSGNRAESDRPVTFAVAGPRRAEPATRGAGRRVTLDAERPAGSGS